MDYVPYLAVLRRHIVVIVALTALGVGVAAYLSHHQHKVYAAQATLLINPAAPSQAIPYLQAYVDNTGAATSPIQVLASTYDGYLHLRSFDSLVVQNLHLDESPEVLGGQITTALDPNTNIFHIDVQAGSALDAQRIANGVAELFIRQNHDLQLRQQAEQQSSNDRLVATMRTLITQVQTLDSDVSRQPGAASASQQMTLAAIEARLSTLAAAFNQLLSQQDAAGSSRVLNTATLTDPAVLPTQPISPSLKKDVLFGAGIGLAVGLLLAFLLEYFNDLIRSAADVERITGHLPLAALGTIGGRMIRGGRRRSTTTSVTPEPVRSAEPAAVRGVSLDLLTLDSRIHRHAGDSEVAPADLLPALVTVYAPRDPVSEAFRTLRTNLAFSSLAKPARTLVVTSVLPGEGKSTITANLGVVLAQSGKRVILVDTDLRQPTLHAIFQVQNTDGFTDLLLGDGDPGACLRDTPITNLQLLTSGSLPSNPAELLSSEASVPLIAHLSSRADIVIFDTPPLGSLTDAVVLSTRVEGTLLVVRSGAGRPSAVVKALDMLRKVGARPLGVALNMVDAATLREPTYYHTRSTPYMDVPAPREVSGLKR